MLDSPLTSAHPSTYDPEYSHIHLHPPATRLHPAHDWTHAHPLQLVPLPSLIFHRHHIPTFKAATAGAYSPLSSSHLRSLRPHGTYVRRPHRATYESLRDVDGAPAPHRRTYRELCWLDGQPGRLLCGISCVGRVGLRESKFGGWSA